MIKSSTLVMPNLHNNFLPDFQIFIWGVVHWQLYLSFSTFSNCFTHFKWFKMTHNGEFCQKSDLDWLKMANFGHFAGFFIFFPK